MKQSKGQSSQPIASGAFDAAMRRLVRVTPKELDAEEAKYKAMRKRLKDKKAKRKPEK